MGSVIWGYEALVYAGNLGRPVWCRPGASGRLGVPDLMAPTEAMRRMGSLVGSVYAEVGSDVVGEEYATVGTLRDLLRQLRLSGLSPEQVGGPESLPVFAGSPPAGVVPGGVGRVQVHSWDCRDVLVSLPGDPFLLVGIQALPHLERNWQMYRRWRGGESFSHLARLYGLSSNNVRIVLRNVARLMLRSNPCGGSPRRPKQGRDGEIWRRLNAGEQQSRVAREFGVSATRVRQIFARQDRIERVRRQSAGEPIHDD